MRIEGEPIIPLDPACDMARALRLDHELLLLALHDKTGKHAFGSMLAVGLGGALFTELLLAGHLGIAKGAGRWNRDLVDVHGAPPRGTPLLAEAHERVAGKRRKRPQAAVTAIAGLSGLRHRVAQELCRMGVLRETEDRILLLFRRRLYPTVDPGPERELIERLRRALTDSDDLDERTSALIALADVSGTLKAVATKAELKSWRPRIKAVRDGSAGGTAARDAVEAAHAAVAASIAATTAATTAASSAAC